MGGTKRNREEKASLLDSAAALDGQHPRKRLQKYSDEDARLANFFSDLADDVRATRTNACKDIVRFLEHASKEQKDRILQRLVRGLCSSRKSARLGFSLTFTAFLDKQCGPPTDPDEYQVSDLLSTVESLTTPPANASNQEKRDYQLGRCLAFRAFIQSKLLHGRPAGEGVPIFVQLLDHIFALYKEALFIRQECGISANSILLSAGPTKIPDPGYATALLNSYQKHGLSKTSEGLAAWLEAKRLFPKNLPLPSGIWHKDDPLDPQERSTLVKILRDNVNETDTPGTAATSSGQAQKVPCLAWDTVLKVVVSRTSSTATSSEANTSFFTQFWKEAVDDAFFSAKASSERKAIGLQVVRLGLVRIEGALVPEVLSPHVMRCIINQRSSPSNSLHAAAELPLKALSSRAKQQPELALPFLTTIISKYGLPNFDKLTRSKTLDELLSHIPTSDAEQVLDLFDEGIKHPKATEHVDMGNSQRSLADLSLTFTRKQRPPPASAAPSSNASKLPPNPDGSPFPWTKLFSILARYAYLVTDGDETLSGPIRELYQTRAISCLTHTLDTGMDPDFEHAAHVVTTINKLTKSGKHSLALKGDDQVLQVLMKSSSRLAAIKQKAATATAEEKPTLHAFKLLFALSIVQVHNGDADAVSILEELEQCYEMIGQSNDATTALVEILLGFLSRPSSLFRKLAEQVFAAISTQIGPDGIEALIDILDKPENLSGQQELFENADEVAGLVESEADDTESSDEFDASDVEMVDPDGRQAVDVESSDSDQDSDSTSEDGSSSSDTSDSETIPEPDDELTAFEAKLAQTLGTTKSTAANGAANDDTSDESDMDDDQMMALDGHLTKIFQERTKLSTKKKDNKDAKGNVVSFKNRVLDLLAVFVKQCYSRTIVLDIVSPLLRLIRQTHNKDLSNRAYNVLKSLFDLCAKHKAFPEVDTDELFTMLANIHQELQKNTSKLHASAASRSSLFVVKLAITQDQGNYTRAADMYNTLQKAWYSDPRSKIPNTAFTEWTSWSINSRK